MRKLLFVLTILAFFYACKNDKPAQLDNLIPPKADKVVKEFTEHGTKRLDEYFWMNNPKDTNVLNILKAENAYTTAMLKHTEGVQKKLYDEMAARVEQKSQSVPVLKNGYWYYFRYEEGKEYPLICRKKGSWAAAEEVILNVADMAKGYKIFRLFEYEVNPENNKIAYLVDTSGDRRNTLYIKDLMTDKLLSDKISEVANGGLIWSNNGKNLLYLLNDNTVRSYKAMRHILGADIKTDKLIFTETDNTFDLGMSKTQSHKYIVLESSSTLTSESRFLDADNVDAPARVFLQRQRDLLYSINHFAGDTFYVYNNNQAKNFKLSTTPLSKMALKDWKDVVPHSDSSYLMRYEVLKNYIVIQDKVKGLNKIRIIDRNTQAMENVDFGEEAYVANMYLANNDNYDIDSIRFNYASLTTPNSTFLYDFKTKSKTILKEDKVAGFNTSEYETKRIWVKSRDSVEVPVSIVYNKKRFAKDGSNPLLLYAYGSYGNSTEPYFNQAVVSLLDRGFVYAIAHIRGGQELGRKWYEDGKLLKKKNTFNDFVDCAEYLVKERYTKSDKLFANGGSAGGMLMGAVVNQKPELWRGVLAEVPWMDVITDMYNDQLPLTSLEWDEWGNPVNKEYYDYMLSWSPYDQVRKANYPAIFATGGLNDTQVPYFSPAKWVQRVRDNNTGKNPVLFKCNMDAGHGGQSGRFERYKLTALKYAFMLDLLGVYE
jgi:oligopeptidase B